MVYYPLQLLQLAGVREVLVVTGKHHAGPDDRPARRRASREPGRRRLRCSISISRYKVQTEAGGIAQVVGMARDFARGDGLVVVLGDNIFERVAARRPARLGRTARRAQIFVKAVPDPEAFGVVVYDEDGDGRRTSSRRRASSTCGTTRRRRRMPSWGSTATRRTSSTSSTASSRPARRARDHRRQPALRAGGAARCDARSRAGGRTPGKHWQHLAEIGRRIDEDGRQQ